MAARRPRPTRSRLPKPSRQWVARRRAADTTAKSRARPGAGAVGAQAGADRRAAQARTLEQVVGELLEPVIRQWLETNLPRLVEKVVREEVARAIAAERGAPKV